MSSRPPVARLVLLLALLVGVILAAFWFQQRRATSLPPAVNPASIARELAAAVTVLEARERQADETYWVKDLLASRCGAVFEELWDAVNAAAPAEKLGVLAAFPPGEVVQPEFAPAQLLPHDIRVLVPRPKGRNMAAGEWAGWVRSYAQAGWQLSQVEFRHNRFETDATGQPARSVFWFAAHLVNTMPSARATLVGDLAVYWEPQPGTDGLPAPRRIDASQLVLQFRPGEAPFRLVLDQTLAPPPKSHFIDPLIVQDLDGDGRPEIILASANECFHWREGRLESRPFLRGGSGLMFTGILGDFDGDGAQDFLAAKFDGLTLFKGSAAGVFDQPERPAWTVSPRLRYVQALTAGDVDGDGDLDVWLGQYKNPYDGGQMPTPYFDANDGNPAYLLLNDGQGHFTDATQAAGLQPKRWRRTYSASLVDLDDDGDLDLLAVNDFAGVEAWRNDGHGHFSAAGRDWLEVPPTFGMSHTFGDFNADGTLDFFVTGMNCSTPLRMDALGLNRPDRPENAAMRRPTSEGNRLLFGRPSRGYALAMAGEPATQSGWSWGCVAEDFDNDGFPDLAITNGHETRQFTRDYDPEFWRHDIYVATSQDDPVVNAYFGAKMARTRGQGTSYGGWYKNRLYLNQAGQAFAEVGHLLGVALEADSRNASAGDFDGDGRLDLVVTTFEVWPSRRQTVKVFRNELPTVGHWLGLRFRDQPGAPSAIGATVTLRHHGQSTVRPLVTGDSHRSQHMDSLRFGLGTGTDPAEVQIRWPGGTTTQLKQLAPDRDHRIPSPKIGQ